MKKTNSAVWVEALEQRILQISILDSLSFEVISIVESAFSLWQLSILSAIVARPLFVWNPVHKNITATVFWVGEPKGNGSSENNAFSAWDDAWEEHYGGYDDYQHRDGYFPSGFIPKENPFYVDLPYNDFNNKGIRRHNAERVVPWAHTRTWSSNESMMKNQWVKITKGDMVCYGQIEDAGPYQYNDYRYVFGSNRIKPHNKRAHRAGMDVSPAVRDYLGFQGLNDDSNKVNWQFVQAKDVPNGPWKQIVTTSQVHWVS
jgi:hypothetical protein